MVAVQLVIIQLFSVASGYDWLGYTSYTTKSPRTAKSEAPPVYRRPAAEFYGYLPASKPSTTTATPATARPEGTTTPPAQTLYRSSEVVERSDPSLAQPSVFSRSSLDFYGYLPISKPVVKSVPAPRPEQLYGEGQYSRPVSYMSSTTSTAQPSTTESLATFPDVPSVDNADLADAQFYSNMPFSRQVSGTLRSYSTVPTTPVPTTPMPTTPGSYRQPDAQFYSNMPFSRPVNGTPRSYSTVPTTTVPTTPMPTTPVPTTPVPTTPVPTTPVPTTPVPTTPVPTTPVPTTPVPTTPGSYRQPDAQFYSNMPFSRTVTGRPGTPQSYSTVTSTPVPTTRLPTIMPPTPVPTRPELTTIVTGRPGTHQSNSVPTTPVPFRPFPTTTVPIPTVPTIPVYSLFGYSSYKKPTEPTKKSKTRKTYKEVTTRPISIETVAEVTVSYGQQYEVTTIAELSRAAPELPNISNQTASTDDDSVGKDVAAPSEGVGDSFYYNTFGVTSYKKSSKQGSNDHNVVSSKNEANESVDKSLSLTVAESYPTSQPGPAGQPVHRTLGDIPVHPSYDAPGSLLKYVDYNMVSSSDNTKHRSQETEDVSPRPFCHTEEKVEYEDRCETYKEETCHTLNREECHTETVPKCRPVLKSRVEEVCLNITDKVCSLVESEEEHSVEEVFTVGSCFTVMEEVCDQSWQVVVSEQEQLQCLDLETVNCTQDSLTLSDTNCTEAVEFNCSQDKYRERPTCDKTLTRQCISTPKQVMVTTCKSTTTLCHNLTRQQAVPTMTEICREQPTSVCRMVESVRPVVRKTYSYVMACNLFKREVCKMAEKVQLEQSCVTQDRPVCEHHLGEENCREEEKTFCYKAEKLVEVEVCDDLFQTFEI